VAFTARQQRRDVADGGWRLVLDVELAEGELVSTYLKADPSRAVAVRFPSGDGVELAGLLYLPPAVA
jgi:hypothetical protein